MCCWGLTPIPRSFEQQKESTKFKTLVRKGNMLSHAQFGTLKWKEKSSIFIVLSSIGP